MCGMNSRRSQIKTKINKGGQRHHVYRMGVSRCYHDIRFVQCLKCCQLIQNLLLQLFQHLTMIHSTNIQYGYPIVPVQLTQSIHLSEITYPTYFSTTNSNNNRKPNYRKVIASLPNHLIILVSSTLSFPATINQIVLWCTSSSIILLSIKLLCGLTSQ